MKKSYRCTECGNLFYEEEPIATIPVSVIWCPRCDNLAERYDIAENMTNADTEEKGVGVDILDKKVEGKCQ